MTKNWPPAAWDAINQLAELDLANYSKHVFDRDAWLGTARAKRVDQHRTLIDSLLAGNPHVTAAEVVGACNPQPLRQDPPIAARRDYEAGFVGGTGESQVKQFVCKACSNTGVAADGFCGCPRGVGKQFFDAYRQGRRSA